MYIRRLLLRLHENERSLNEAYRIFLREARGGHAVPRSAEWLLDNFFLVSAQILEIRQTLAQGLDAELPLITAGPYTGYPRVYALAMELIQETDSYFDTPILTRFVQAYQAKSALGLSELCTLPVMLRIGLVENLKRLIEQSLAPVSPSESSEISIQRANSVGNTVTSLRLVATLVWQKLIESWSLYHLVLVQDPTNAYAQSDFETRQRYRHIIAELSKRTNVSEVEVAQRALELARREQVRNTRRAHVGYYLIDRSLSELKQQLGYSPKSSERLNDWISEEAQNELRLLAHKMWDFFDRLATEADHWLPPDNYRTNPKPAVAHRTSPTNIGCLLLAMIAAFDFKLITAGDLSVRLERVLTTLERMERVCGHWCNWYDTLTLDVLHPFYVSSVDSGNLAAALIVVKQACLELARTPEANSDSWCSIANRADTFVREMDFRFMYNSERDLFAIGYNLETNQNDNKYYDLFGSEARLTSYIAIAMGQIPERHWFQLGRPFRDVNGHPTLVCWGGSLFEYLLPTLFFPDYPGTLADETYAKVIAHHIRYGIAHGAPWGNAEAGYYAFDADCNYQYKMFGVPDLSVRHELMPEFVVPSYATFLALPYVPRRAWENLQALKRLGGLDEFGFYESFDFTAGRLPEGQTVGIVQEFMAHHQGISLAALDNFLNRNAIRRRFHREPATAAFEFLLQERVSPHIQVVKMPVVS